MLEVDNACSIPNLRVRGHACKTNLPSNTDFRGFVFPRAGLFVETCTVAVATQTGIPHEKVKALRLPNKTQDNRILGPRLSEAPCA